MNVHLSQVAGARAERDTLADQNAALARTTHQLMAGAPTLEGSLSLGSVGSLGVPASAPVSFSGGGTDGSVGPLPVRQRALSEPASAVPETTAGKQNVCCV